jgi:hypothetical protein
MAMKKVLMLAGLALCVATPALANASCLQLSQIWNWKAVDNKTLIVEDNFHQKFKLSLMTTCPDLLFKENLGFKSFGGTGLSCLTRGDDVIDRDRPLGAFRCPISNIETYTPAMEKADKEAAAAKQSQP